MSWLGCCDEGEKWWWFMDVDEGGTWVVYTQKDVMVVGKI